MLQTWRRRLTMAVTAAIVLGMLGLANSAVANQSDINLSPEDQSRSAAQSPGKPEVFMQMGHSGSIKSVACSPDDKYVLSGGSDGSIILWERDSGREIRTIRGHAKEIQSVAFSADGKRIVSASLDDTAKLWDVATGREIRTFSSPKDEHDRVNSAAISPDGLLIAAGRGVWVGGAVKILGVETGQLLQTLKHRSVVNAVAFSPDGRYLLSGSGNVMLADDGDVILWEVATGKEVRRFAGHSSGLIFKTPAGVSHVGFSADGRYALSISVNQTITVWEVESGRKIRTFSETFWSRGDATFSPDGRSILAVKLSEEKIYLQLLDVASGQEVRSLDVGSRVEDMVDALAFSKDGHYLLFSQRYSLGLLDLNTWTVVRSYARNAATINSLAFSPDGTQVLAGHDYLDFDLMKAGQDSQNLQLWDVAVGRKVRTMQGHAASVLFTQFSRDGRHLFSAGRHVKIWEAASGRLIRRFPEKDDKTDAVWAVSQDGRTFVRASASIDRRKLELWNAETGELIRKLSEKFGHTKAISFSPDGRYILWAGEYDEEGRNLQMWDVIEDRRVWTADPSSHDDFSAVAWAPGGHSVLSITNYFGNLTLRNAMTGQTVREFEMREGVAAKTIAFSPDGRTFLSGFEDGTVTRWDVDTGQKLWSLASHEGPVTTLAISPDGKRVVSGGDGTVLLREIASGREILRMATFTDGEWIAITPKGYYAASEKGAQYLNVRIVNHVYGIDNFFEQFYRPDVVAEVLRPGESDMTVLPTFDKKEHLDLTQAVKLPPSVRILSPKPGESFDRDEVEVQVQAADQGGGVDEIRLFHNGKVVGTDTRGAIPLVEAPMERTQPFRVKLIVGPNVLRAVAWSKDRIEGNPYELTIQLRATAKPAILHLFLVGINKYKNPALDLNYALPDAWGMQQFFSNAPATLFKEVTYIELYDRKATKEAILDKLKDLQQSAPQDVVVIYLAGHGDSIENIWYFVPWEVTTPEREEVMKAQGFSSVELKDQIAKIGAQKVLILIDACKSGAAMLAFAGRGVEDRKALAQLARSTGVHVVAASTKEQLATEIPALGHGVFTYTLLEGLSGQADGSPKDGTVTVRELLSYVESRLPEISEKYKQQAQYPVVDSRGQDFPLATAR